jgi:hypothetical protein
MFLPRRSARFRFFPDGRDCDGPCSASERSVVLATPASSAHPPDFTPDTATTPLNLPNRPNVGDPPAKDLPSKSLHGNNLCTSKVCTRVPAFRGVVAWKKRANEPEHANPLGRKGRPILAMSATRAQSAPPALDYSSRHARSYGKGVPYAAAQAADQLPGRARPEAGL